ALQGVLHRPGCEGLYPGDGNHPRPRRQADLDDREGEVPLQRQDVHHVLRAAALVALMLAGSAQGATGQGAALAKTLKPTIQRFYKAKGSDDVFTKVTCVLPMNATVAHCKAYFTSAKFREHGWFDITANVNRTTGNVTWRATKVTCLSPATGKAIAC